MTKSLPVLLLAFASTAQAAHSFEGAWFSCERKTGEYYSLEVSQLNGKYSGLLESSHNGGVYSAELRGTARAGKLVLSGCQAYRGETPEKCDPPVVVTLGESKSSFKRVSSQSFGSSAAECRRRAIGS
jgi:hypothetical protein